MKKNKKRKNNKKKKRKKKKKKKKKKRNACIGMEHVHGCSCVLALISTSPNRTQVHNFSICC